MKERIFVPFFSFPDFRDLDLGLSKILLRYFFIGNASSHKPPLRKKKLNLFTVLMLIFHATVWYQISLENLGFMTHYTSIPRKVTRASITLVLMLVIITGEIDSHNSLNLAAVPRLF